MKLTPADVIDQKLILRSPKSGKEHELVYIPQKLAERLKEYIAVKKIDAGRRIFPITYVPTLEPQFSSRAKKLDPNPDYK